MRRWIAIAAAPAALFAGGVAALAAEQHTSQAAQATGGLAISPAILTHAPLPGSLGAMTVTNRSSEALTVTVTPRPWTQSASGRFAASRKGSLGSIKLSTSTFTLAPNAEQKVDLSLTAAPAGGSLYGALEVIGLPADADKRTGVVLGYRLVGSLRLPPAQKKRSLSAGQVKRVGRAVVLPLTNGGNTIDPISGDVSVKGARGTLNDDIDDLRILPGKKVNVELASGLRSGAYSATVTFEQGGTKLLTAKRRFSVR
jgi:hypothetical protein